MHSVHKHTVISMTLEKCKLIIEDYNKGETENNETLVIFQEMSPEGSSSALTTGISNFFLLKLISLSSRKSNAGGIK